MGECTVSAHITVTVGAEIAELFHWWVSQNKYLGLVFLENIFLSLSLQNQWLEPNGSELRKWISQTLILCLYKDTERESQQIKTERESDKWCWDSATEKITAQLQQGNVGIVRVSKPRIHHICTFHT